VLVSVGFPALLRLETLLDGVLVTSRKGGEDEIACVRVTRVDRKTGALGHGVDDREHVAKVEIGLDTLRVEVEGESDEVDVSSSFTVAKDGAFYAVSAG
jgi:hypothetical protein